MDIKQLTQTVGKMDLRLTNLISKLENELTEEMVDLAAKVKELEDARVVQIQLNKRIPNNIAGGVINEKIEAQSKPWWKSFNF